MFCIFVCLGIKHSKVVKWQQSHAQQVTTSTVRKSAEAKASGRVEGAQVLILIYINIKPLPYPSPWHVYIGSWICFELLMASSNCSRIIIKPMNNQQVLVHRIHGDQALAP